MIERAFRTAHDDADIGVLTASVRKGDTAVVLLNAGAMRRAGPFRLHVHAARRFAALGFPTLRIDQPGIADHIASARRPHVDVLVDGLHKVHGCALDGEGMARVFGALLQVAPFAVGDDARAGQAQQQHGRRPCHRRQAAAAGGRGRRSVTGV